MMWGIEQAVQARSARDMAIAQMSASAYRAVERAIARHGANFIEIRREGFRETVVFWGKTRIPAIKRGR